MHKECIPGLTILLGGFENFEFLRGGGSHVSSHLPEYMFSDPMGAEGFFLICIY